MNKTIQTSFAVLSLLLSAVAQSQPHQVTADIEQAALNFAQGALAMGQTIYSVQPLDRRLKLAACDQALNAATGPGTRAGNKRVLIKVSCPGTRPWKVFVSLIASRKVQVLVAARTLTAGHRLMAEDLGVSEIDSAQLRSGFLSNPEAAIGTELKQVVHAGEVLFRYQTSDPVLIQRGHQVNILSQAAGISIRMSGIAQDPGRKNQQIRVKNLSSGRLVYGRVISADEVSVGIP